MEKEMFEPHNMPSSSSARSSSSAQSSSSAHSSSSAPRYPKQKKSSLYVWTGGVLKGYDYIYKLFFKRYWMQKAEELENMLILEKRTSPEQLYRWKSSVAIGCLITTKYTLAYKRQLEISGHPTEFTQFQSLLDYVFEKYNEVYQPVKDLQPED